jgi:hypothetical protein
MSEVEIIMTASSAKSKDYGVWLSATTRAACALLIVEPHWRHIA